MATPDALPKDITTPIVGILCAAFGNKVQLADSTRLGGSERSRVYRVHIGGAMGDAPTTAIVKQAVAVEGEDYNPDRAGGPAWRLFNEWAGLEFLTRVMGGLSPAPSFYGGDRDAGLILIEDMGDGTRLDHLLLDTDAVAAEEGLIEFARALGAMHAATIGKQVGFDRIRDSLGPRPERRSLFDLASEGGENTGKAFVAAIHRTIATLGITPVAGVEGELDQLVESLTNPGQFLAYTHGDPCPDNCLRDGYGMRLLDFEFGEYRHALVDGVYGRFHFPSCWCVNRLPTPVVEAMEAAYRLDLATTCPEASDDWRFYRAVTEACAYWTLGMFHWYPISRLLKQDVGWGISTVRQRMLLRLGILGDTSRKFGHLERVGDTARAIANRLRDAWPSEADDMPYYPAFRS